MNRVLIAASFVLLTSVLFGYEVSIGTFVANPGQRVAVPVRFDTVKDASHVGVRITYDPQVLVLVKAEEGSLVEELSDDYVVVGNEREGVVSVSAFGIDNVVTSSGGTLSTLFFKVREGTAGLYSDLAISSVSVGEKTGVKDLTLENPVRTRNGMVRVMSQSAAVTRLEGEQMICADAVLGSVAFKPGDSIQASDAQTAIMVTGPVSSEGQIAVLAPSEGWTSGRYELLKAPTTGLSLVLTDAPAGAVVGTDTKDGVTTYFAEVTIAGETPIVCESEPLSAGAKIQIRKALAAAGVSLNDVKRIAVSGPAGNVSLIADLGIAPAVSAIDGTGTLNVTYTMPTITITSFNPETGVVRIRVVPGEGNKIVSELATGYVHVYGTSNLAEKMKYISKVGFDLTPYLRAETKGEASLTVDIGTHSFLKVKIEETPKVDGATE